MPDPTGKTISAPGFYPDLSEDDYHGDPCPAPSLSSTVARTLIDRSPLHAWTAHPRLNPNHQPIEKKALDFGSAAHMLVLGKGRDIEVLDFESYRSNAAKAVRDAANEAGKTPILAADFARAEEMAEEFFRQITYVPLAAEAFGSGGASEVAFVWRDGGTWCRGKADRLLTKGGGSLLVDYKTTSASAHPQAVSRRLYDMGQDFQLAFYRRGIQALTGDKRFSALLLTQEIEPPYALSVMTLDEATWEVAEQKVTTAILTWEACLKSGKWPGYPSQVGTAELPPWIENAWLDQRDRLRDQPNILLAG